MVSLLEAHDVRVCFEDFGHKRRASRQGLTLAHFKAQLEDLLDTSLTLKLNLSNFGPHPGVNLGYMGNDISLS